MIMVEAGFSSPRMDAFPAGLRVLVVDDDPTWLKILEKMLKKCHYEVTTCGLAREALKALREHKDGFDIVISDVNMPDMDGFKLLEHVGLEMDLPVIMMSVDGETSRVMKGVQHGACDYLLKPIRMKELRNIWQHVFRKKMREVKDIEGHDYYEDIQMFRNGSESSDDSPFITGGDHTSIRKRKDTDNKYDEKDYNDPSSTKKPRVVWSVDLHQKFVKAVNQIGFDKVGPKKILELMKVPRLTRENVASHLQKYRLYLSRLQKENEQKTSNGPLNSDSLPKDSGASFCFQESSCGGSKNSDHPPRDPDAGRFGLQISMNMQQRDAAGSSQLFPANKLPMTTSDTRSSDIDLKSFNMLPLTEPTEPIKSDISGSCEASPVGLDHSFGQVEPITKYAAFESPGSVLYPWSGELPESRYKHEYKPQQLDDIFNHPTIEAVEHPPIESDLLQPAACISSRLSTKQEDQVSPAEMKPLSAKINCNDIGQPVPIGTALRESTFDSKSHLLNLQQQFDPAPSGSAFDAKNHSTSHNDTLDLEYGQLNQIQGTESAFVSLADELKAYWLQDYNFTAGPSFDSTGVHHYNLPQLISDVPTHLHSMPRFDESFYDLMEYPVVDQSLSIT